MSIVPPLLVEHIKLGPDTVKLRARCPALHIPNHMFYVYFPIFDEGLPDLKKLHAVARLGARLVANGEKVLAHCGMGFNRSALVAGLVRQTARKD